MKPVFRYSILTLSLISALSCSTKSEEEKKKPSGVIPEHQLKALEEAKKTDELLQKTFEERNKQLEKDGG